MDSIVAYTEEIDDLNAAAEELFAQVEGFGYRKNSMAILFAEEDTDYPALYALLSQKWKFPVMGCTAMAMLSGKDGYCRSGISVLILTADDCQFSVGITDEMNGDTYKEGVERLYAEAASQHTSELKLGLTYYGVPVAEQRMSGNNLISALDGAAKGLPLYGGAASDNLTFAGYRVFYNERVVQNGMVLALISGNVSPRFVRVNSVEHKASFSYEITRAEDSVVYRLGDGTFVETLKKENMRADRENMMSAYILSPFLVTIDQGNGDKVEVARILSTLDFETGSGTFLGVMPEKATLSFGVLEWEDVRRTVHTAFNRIYKELEQAEGSYTTLLCNSCSARFLALIDHPAAEAEAFLGHLPQNLSLMGIYPYGECCPVQGEKTGKMYNMLHNFTFTILAL